MPQAEIIRAGTFSAAYELDSPRLSLREKDMDRLVLSYAAPERTAFARGQTAPAPWSNFVIVDLEAEQDADEWLFNLQCEGNASGADRFLGTREPKVNLEDWDETSFEVITRNVALYTPGQIMAGPWLAMVCERVDPKDARGTWQRLAVSGKGLKRSKNYVRRMTCNGQTFSSDSARWPVFPGGWNTARKSVIDLPQIQITDTHFGTSRPNTTEVPGSKTPPDAPPLRNLGSVVITGGTSYWPNGWKYSITGAQQLGLSTLWKWEANYTVQWANLPS